MAGKKPTHYLIIRPKDKNSRGRTRAGVAWMNEEGWLSIVLHPGIVLDHRLCEDHYLSVYPYKGNDDEPPMPEDAPEEYDDDIPF